MSAARIPAATRNRLLDSLPVREMTRWWPHLEVVSFRQGDVLLEAGRAASHAYFPTTAVVSLSHVLEDGFALEVATVGNDGLVGVSLFMGGDSTPGRAMVLGGGEGFRLRYDVLRQAFVASDEVRDLLLRYTQALLTQMGQVGVCTRHHTVMQQLCRWLLLNLDRLPATELALTQELIAQTLGLRREAVCDAALKLQEAGLIRYKRGRIHVLRRDGIERCACECYDVITSEYERLLRLRRTPPAPWLELVSSSTTHRAASDRRQ